MDIYTISTKDFKEDIIMSIKLANGEVIVKNYEYGTVNVTGVAKNIGSHRNLIVTNRRVIHQETSLGRGTERISTKEMPVKSANHVSTFYGMKNYPIFLILGIIFAIIAVVMLIAIPGGAAKIVSFIVAGIIAVVFFILYAKKRDYTLTCSIDSEAYISHSLNFSTKSGNSMTKGFFARFRRADNSNVINVKVSVDHDVAKLLAEELGSVIIAAANGDYDVVADEAFESETYDAE